MIFEFFMPLTNESELRTSLDALFYRDTLLGRLRSILRKELQARFTKKPEEEEDVYLDRIARWASNTFVGYSILHVDGRFRATGLKSLTESAGLQSRGGRYLVDETTAIVRFIFPCGKPKTTGPPLSESQLGSLMMEPEEIDENTRSEADKIGWLFGILFVQSIVQAVNGEDEIWMVESGLRSRLHIWRVNE